MIDGALFFHWGQRRPRHNMTKHLLLIHYDNIWSGSGNLFPSEMIGKDISVPFRRQPRYGAQLMLEYGCHLQLSLLSNHKQMKEHCLQIKHCLVTNFHASFSWSIVFTWLEILAWNPDGRELRNEFAIFSPISTASLPLTSLGATWTLLIL